MHKKMVNLLMKSMTHKLNTPINAMKGFLAYVKLKTSQILDDQSIPNSILACEESITILQHIVQNLTVSILFNMFL